MAFQLALAQQTAIFQVAHGTDANKSKWAKRAKKGWRYWATDTKKMYFASQGAGSNAASLVSINPSATGQ